MAMQLSNEQEFYSRLLNCRPPDPTEKDWIEFCGDEIISKAKAYTFIQDQIKDLERQADEIKKQIILGTGGTSRALIGDIKLQKVIRQGAVDYAKIEALKGLDLTPYRKEPITSWRIS
jgi:hypothetical protein